MGTEKVNREGKEEGEVTRLDRLGWICAHGRRVWPEVN